MTFAGAWALVTSWEHEAEQGYWTAGERRGYGACAAALRAWLESQPEAVAVVEDRL